MEDVCRDAGADPGAAGVIARLFERVNMSFALNEQAQKVLSLAADEARRFNHEYVGTEHVLLGLMLEGSSDTAGALGRLGVSIDNVRAEIERLVLRGPMPITIPELPLTPRANRVVQFAFEEAAVMSQPQAGPAHLLIALIREPDGVAGQVMRNLGLSLRRVWEESLKIRLSLMKIVERIVRPLKASIRHKRKVREELLGHLTATYEEELSRDGDPFAALTRAANRFGDPSDLSRELQQSVPKPERFGHFVEHWLGWRPGETGLRYITRSSLLSFGILVAILGIPLVVASLYQGWDESELLARRSVFALIALIPATQFLMELMYLKLRAALSGFGTRNPLLKGIGWSLAIALSVFAASISYLAIAQAPMGPENGLAVSAIVAILAALACLIRVRVLAMTEWRDTLWGTLDLETIS
jgi:hypothetical protein